MGPILMLTPAQAQAERENADRHQPACFRCGDRGIYRVDGSSWYRCDCPAGRAIWPNEIEAKRKVA